jgi:hypothetical protein
MIILRAIYSYGHIDFHAKSNPDSNRQLISGAVIFKSHAGAQALGEPAFGSGTSVTR